MNVFKKIRIRLFSFPSSRKPRYVDSPAPHMAIIKIRISFISNFYLLSFRTQRTHWYFIKMNNNICRKILNIQKLPLGYLTRIKIGLCKELEIINLGIQTFGNHITRSCIVKISVKTCPRTTHPRATIR